MHLKAGVAVEGLERGKGKKILQLNTIMET